MKTDLLPLEHRLLPLGTQRLARRIPHLLLQLLRLVVPGFPGQPAQQLEKKGLPHSALRQRQ